MGKYQIVCRHCRKTRKSKYQEPPRCAACGKRNPVMEVVDNKLTYSERLPYGNGCVLVWREKNTNQTGKVKTGMFMGAVRSINDVENLSPIPVSAENRFDCA